MWCGNISSSRIAPQSRLARVMRGRKSMRGCKALFSRRIHNHLEVSPSQEIYKVTHSLRFHTRTLYLRERRAFYEEGRGWKRVPANLTQLLSPASLAVWFMDDGGRGGNSKYGMVLDVTGFNQEERVLIQQILRNKFLIGTTIHQSSSASRHNSAKIFVLKRWDDPFREIISSFLVPTIRYKIESSTRNSFFFDRVKKDPKQTKVDLI